MISINILLNQPNYYPFPNLRQCCAKKHVVCLYRSEQPLLHLVVVGQDQLLGGGVAVDHFYAHLHFLQQVLGQGGADG